MSYGVIDHRISGGRHEGRKVEQLWEYPRRPIWHAGPVSCMRTSARGERAVDHELNGGFTKAERSCLAGSGLCGLLLWILSQPERQPAAGFPVGDKPGLWSMLGRDRSPGVDLGLCQS